MRPPRPRLIPWLFGCALLIITMAVYWNVTKGEFVRWDDDIKIYRNEHLGSFSRENLAWMFTDTQRLLYYAPVSWLLLNGIWHFYHLNPFGYHLASLLLHCANTLLVFLLIHQILHRISDRTVASRPVGTVSQVSQPADATTALQRTESRDPLPTIASWLIAGIATLLWSLHPLRVEAVAWATPISHLLASFFVLLSFLLYLRFRQSHSQPIGFYLASLVCFLAAMLSYPVVLAFPAILIISDLYFRITPVQREQIASASREVPPPIAVGQRERKPDEVESKNRSGWPSVSEWKSLFRSWIPFMLVSVVVLAITLYGRSHAVRFWSAPVSLNDFNLLQRLAQAFFVWAYYLWKPLLPFGLSPVDLNLSTVNPAGLRFIIPALVICALTVLLWLKRRRFPGLLALWLCYLVLLVPMLGLTEYPHYTSDRYSYLPAVVQTFLLASLLTIAFQSRIWRLSAVSLSFLLIGACAFLSVRQVEIWHDSRTLFAHILSLIDKTPAAGVIHTRLGFVLADAGEADAALPQFETALRFYPGYWEAYAGLGRAFSAKTNWSDALNAYEKAIAANPSDAQTRFERAAILAQQRRVGEAVSGYLDGLRLDPNNIEALNNLAWILATTVDDKARDGARAVSLALRACLFTRFENPVLIGTLAAAYAEAGTFNLAIETAQKARDLARASGNKSVATRNEELLGLYKSGKPYRE